MGNSVSSMSWPPDIDTVNKYGAHALVATLLPAVGMTLITATDKITEKEKEFLERELEKRRKKLSEMCDFVDTHLKELTEKRQKKQEEEGKKIEDEDDTNDDEDLEVKLRFSEIFECCVETEEIDPKNEDLGRGLALSAALMREEIEKLTRKTEQGDPQYRDGSELENVLDDHQRFIDATRKMYVSSEHKGALSANSNELWVTFRNGERVVRKIRNTDFMKAGRLVMLARKSLPFVAASTSISAAQGMLGAMEFLYRTQSLEIFRSPQWKWSDFYRVTRAVLWTRALTCAMSILKVRFDAIGNEELGHIIRTEMYKALLRQDFEWYRLGQKDARNIGEMFQSIFSVPRYVTQFIGTPMEIVKLSTNILTQIMIIRQKSSRLLYAMMAMYWLKFGIDRGIRFISELIQRVFLAKIITPNHQIFMDPINPENLQTVRSFGAEEKAISMWNVFWKSVSRENRQYEILSASIMPIQQAFNESTTMAEHGWAGKLILEGDLKVEEMETTMHFSQQVSSQIHGAGHTFRNVYSSFAPLAKAWDIVSLKPTIGMEGGLIPEVRRAKGEIEFTGVSFKYPTGNQILRQVTFKVPAGKVCGITGESGGGKSTIFKLVERFYDVKEGSIKLDGHDIKELNPVWLRTQISVVSQKPRFLHLPLRENLAYGCAKEPSTEEIEQACRAANIYELVFDNKEKFPAGLYTYVSESTLSGGELQRLSIARAILMDAPILFLDEATSALDSESQSLVNEALKNLMTGRTVLSIAHRLEAIKDADMIICLAAPKDGEAEEKSTGDVLEKKESKKSAESGEDKKVRKGFTIAETGTHSELIALGKVYAGLYKKQIESTVSGGSGTGLASIPESPQEPEKEDAPDNPQPQEPESRSMVTQPVNAAAINELRRMHADLQEEPLDELAQQALAVRLQAIIERIERNEEPEEEETSQSEAAPGAKAEGAFRKAVFKVMANRSMFEQQEVEPLIRSCRSAILQRSCSSSLDIDHTDRKSVV